MLATMIICQVLGSSTELEPPPKQVMNEGDRQRVQFVLAGLRNCIESVHSGVFRARGRFEEVDRKKAGAPVFETNTEIFCAFDVSSRRWRFDRDELPTGNLNTTGKADHLKYVRTQTAVVTWHERQGMLLTLPPDAPTPNAELKLFDPRLLGIINVAELELGADYDLLINQLYLDPEMVNLTEFRSETPTLHRATWVIGKFQNMVRVWIDANLGFAPVRREDFERDLSVGAPKWSDSPNSVSELTWEKKSDAWVARTFSIWRTSSSRKASYALTFDWQSVNEPVDDLLFSADGLVVPKGTMLVDMSTGTSVVTGLVGSDVFAPPEPPKKWAWGRRWGFATSAVVLFFACLVVLRVFVVARARVDPRRQSDGTA